jgi:hypothetical protein
LITRWATTGRWVNPHPIGVAVLMMPFFGLAHLLTRWSNLPLDGFSFYYQHGAGLAGIAALLVGLASLRRLLTPHFSDGVTLATLVSITWGTNLFHYAVFDGTYSHVYSFCLVAVLLRLTEDWWMRAGWQASVGLGVTAGLIGLVRHPNLLFLVVVPLYGLMSADRPFDALLQCWRRRTSIVIATTTMVVVVSPQLWIYHRATKRWFVSAYGQIGGFMFGSPHLIEVLVGVRNGLFFWSPVLLFAVGGVLVAHTWARRWLAAALVVFAAETYLIASWWDWGGSFGNRGFTDGLPLAAVFLAAAFAWIAERPVVRVFATGTAAIAVMLSAVQMIQYWLRVLPMSDITWEQYRQLFLQF